MATILDFPQLSLERTRQTAMRAVDTNDSGESAELIFFPGVRYEREEPQSPSPKRKARGRSHDQIDLPD